MCDYNYMVTQTNKLYIKKFKLMMQLKWFKCVYKTPTEKDKKL